jgi:hypothetical protein
MATYLDYKEIVEKWKIKKIEIFELIKKGLQPYSKDTLIPIPCTRTMQRRLKSIKIKFTIIDKYTNSPDSLTRREEDWLIAYNKSVSEISKDLENEKKIIESKMKHLNKTENDAEDSWKFFHYDASEKMMKFEIDELFKKSVFLDSEVEKILASENKIYLDKLNTANKTKSASKDPFVKHEVLFKQLILDIEFIYEVIKKNPGTKMEKPEEFWKEAVLNKFDENREFFRIIQRSDLAFDDLYRVHGSNIKRDFVGRLCQIVMERCGLATAGIERTHKNYKKIKKKLTDC